MSHVVHASHLIKI